MITEKTRKKMSESAKKRIEKYPYTKPNKPFQKGHPDFTKGKGGFKKGHKINVGRTSYWKGKKQPKEMVEKRKLSNIGKHFSPQTEFKKGHISYFKKHTKETRERISETHKKIDHRPEFHTEETKQKMRIARLKHKIPLIDTSIERKFKEWIESKKINYIHPFNLGDRFQCDFYIPKQNLIVECDGDYWHSLPENIRRDERKDAYAKKCGFNMMRLTEKQINEGHFPEIGLNNKLKIKIS